MRSRYHTRSRPRPERRDKDEQVSIEDQQGEEFLTKFDQLLALVGDIKDAAEARTHFEFLRAEEDGLLDDDGEELIDLIQSLVDDGELIKTLLPEDSAEALLAQYNNVRQLDATLRAQQVDTHLTRAIGSALAEFVERRLEHDSDPDRVHNSAKTVDHLLKAYKHFRAGADAVEDDPEEDDSEDDGRLYQWSPY